MASGAVFAGRVLPHRIVHWFDWYWYWFDAAIDQRQGLSLEGEQPLTLAMPTAAPCWTDLGSAGLHLVAVVEVAHRHPSNYDLPLNCPLPYHVPAARLS